MTNPDWQLILREAIDYDLYANSLWLPVVVGSGSEEEVAVFKHLLGASKVWLTRVNGENLAARPDLPLTTEVLAELHSGWLDAVDRVEFSDVIAFKNFLGEEQSRTFGDIARHAMNHGTYHRGQLRQMVGAQGIEFPDTDFILYSYARDGG